MSPSLNHYPLIIECCRFDSDSAKLENLSAMIEDWEGLLDSAYAHGVYPLIARSLKTINSVPEHIKIILKITNLDIARRNMTMTAELLRIMKLLEENGINALAIKGPVLSQIIYGDITTRQYADIDVLIAQDQIYDAGVILQDIGYTSEYPIKFLKNKTLLKVGKDFSIFNPAQNIHIEFHWQLFLQRQVKKSKINLFDPSNPMCYINGRNVRTLGEDENLIYLLLHGSKHMWERLEWIVDIDRLIRQRSDSIGWDRLMILAKDMEIEVMFYLGLAICHELFKTPLPSEMINKLGSMGKVSQAKAFILEGIIKNEILEEATKSTAFVNLFKIRLNKDSTSAVIRHYFTTLFQLKAFDVYMVNLPNQLSCLYHFIRIYRMFRFYVLRQPHQ